MNQDQLRAKALALFHSLVSGWANGLRRDVTDLQDELNRRLDALQEQMAKYEESLDEARILAFADELARGASAAGGGRDVLGRVRSSMARLEGASSLPDMLNALVQELGQFAPRIALFVIKSGACIGWHGQGFDQSPGFSNDALRRISVPTSADTVFRMVVNTRQSFLGDSNTHKDNVQLLTRIGNILPASIFATPLLIRERVAGVVYADNADSREGLQDTDAIQILVAYASKLLDLLSGATKAPTRTSTSELSQEQVEKIRQTSPPVAASPAPQVSSGEESGTVMFQARDLSGPAVSATPSAAPAPQKTATPTDPDARKQHEDAKRFARLLVSEIKLYNEAKVQQGRKNRELYGLLKDDIERSRQLYAERVPAAVRSTTNYFHEELIRILADGDSNAMGRDYSSGA